MTKLKEHLFVALNDLEIRNSHFIPMKSPKGNIKKWKFKMALAMKKGGVSHAINVF